MMPYLNPRRRRRRAGILGGQRGFLRTDVLLPAVGGGVLAGLTQAYAVPWIVSAVGLAPTGVLYRVVQGGAAVAGAWALEQTRVLPRGWTHAMAGYGLAFATLGLISDLQRGGFGALVPTAEAPAAPAGVSGVGAFYRPVLASSGYGQPGSRSALGTYYAALPRR